MSVTKEEIKKLANLARVNIEDQELESFSKDISNILDYVQEINNANINLNKEGRVGSVFNVIREDIVLNKGDEYTNKLLKNAKSTQERYIKVKKIL